MTRRSISASFNSDEIEAIDSVRKKLGITRGQLIKDSMTFWMSENRREWFDEKRNLIYNHLVSEKLIKPMEKKGKINPIQLESGVISKHTISLLAQAADELEKGLSEIKPQHDAYHTLTKKKPKGRPRIIKKRGRSKA